MLESLKWAWKETTLRRRPSTCAARAPIRAGGLQIILEGHRIVLKTFEALKALCTTYKQLQNMSMWLKSCLRASTRAGRVPNRAEGLQSMLEGLQIVMKDFGSERLIPVRTCSLRSPSEALSERPHNLTQRRGHV